MDPWLINPMVGRCDAVDLAAESGVERVRAQVDAMLTKTRRKFKEYGIGEKPFVVVKADAGSRGAGVLSLRDARDLDGARLQRTLARPAESAGETGAVTELLVQEGVPTNERINDAVAEPVVCMIDRYVVGGYYRVHADRGSDESLDTPGSRYVPLAFSASLLPTRGAKPGASAPNRFYMYGVIARLAMLAASYELEATDPDAETYD
jgi:glutamate--cysteine ligase